MAFLPTHVCESVSSGTLARPAGPRRVEVVCHADEGVSVQRRSGAMRGARKDSTSCARCEVVRKGTTNRHQSVVVVKCTKPRRVCKTRRAEVTNGSGEIRTHGTLSRTHTFQAIAPGIEVRHHTGYHYGSSDDPPDSPPRMPAGAALNWHHNWHQCNQDNVRFDIPRWTMSVGSVSIEIYVPASMDGAADTYPCGRGHTDGCPLIVRP